MATIIGTTGDDQGASQLNGTSDADIITARDGDDDVEGLGGADQIDGGSGTDWAYYLNSDAAVNVSLLARTGSGGHAEGDTLVNIEGVVGSAFGDTLTGDDSANDILGAGGDDVIDGGAGKDNLRGEAGNDTLRGGTGVDTAIFSGTRASATITRSGNDIIVTSAEGTDTLTDVEFLQFSDQTISVESLFPGDVIQVTTLEDVVDANDGVTSLREAITEANAAGTPTTVQLGTGIHSVSVTDSIEITSNVTLRGSGSTQTTIRDMQADLGIFRVANGATFALHDVKLSEGVDGLLREDSTPLQGGGIYNDGGNVSLSNVVLEDLGSFRQGGQEADFRTKAQGADALGPVSGGAVFNSSGSMDIAGSSFVNNRASEGGAIYAAGGNVAIDGTRFDSNAVNGEYDLFGGLKFGPFGAAEGKGAAIFSDASARVNIFADSSATGTSTSFTNHVSQTGDSVSLIEGNGAVYLEPSITVDASNTSASALNEVVQVLPLRGTASAVQSAGPQAAEGDNPILTLASSLNLSVNNTDLAFVQNAILSQTGTEMVIQLAGHRVILTGTDLSYSGDPFGVTDTAALVAAANGTVTGLTITNANGSQTLGTLTGVSDTLDNLITNLQTSASLAGALGTTPTQTGSAGNDTFDTTTGNDTINGSGGTDTVVQGALRGNSTVTQNGSVLTVTGAGTDTFTDVERIQFQDGTLAFDLTGSAGQTFRLYRAAFSREPDEAGLAHNVNIMDGGFSIFDMAAAFIASAEFQQTYGTNITDTVFVTLLYNNVLSRAPDDAGLAGWLALLGSGEQSRQQVLFGFSESAENKAATASLTGDGIWLA